MGATAADWNAVMCSVALPGDRRSNPTPKVRQTLDGWLVAIANGDVGACLASGLEPLRLARMRILHYNNGHDCNTVLASSAMTP